MTQASGTSLAQTTLTTYADGFFSIPATVIEPSVWGGHSKTTTYVYGDPRFPLLPTSVTVNGFSSTGVAVSRTSSVSYSILGQVSLLDGPRTDAVDTTTIEYWQCSTGGSCGQFKRVTNALGQSTTFDGYDSAGRLTQKTGPSGIITTYSYNARGKLIGVGEVGGTLSRSMTMTYDGASRLSTASLPTGQQLTYTYDGADQLLSVSDQLGQKVAYSYDLKGNRTGQTVQDGAGTIARQLAMVYNARDALQSVTVGSGTTQVASDGLGNPIQITDPKGNSTTNQFDALNRLWKTVNALAGATTSVFSAAGDLTQVTAPNGAVFGFDVDDLGNTLQAHSPDAGTSIMVYDPAGNLKSKTDARGVTVNYVYDAMNRVVQVNYPSGVENSTYGYDSCSAGQLCSVTDASGTYSFQYDGFARRTQEVWTAVAALGGHAYTTTYVWTAFDRVQSITSPTGRSITYAYDNVGRLTAASSGGMNIVSGRAYRPDGELVSQTFGNGIAEGRTYDTAGRLTNWTIGGIETRSYGHDLNGNITSISVGGNTRAFGYDAIDRLISEPDQAFAWDGNGNRLSDASGSFTYAPASNRMTAGPAGLIGVDPAGYTTMIGSRTFGYSESGALVQASVGGTVVGTYSYRHNALRASKSTSGGTTLFHWDLFGNLIDETTSAGAPVRSYAWAESVAIAQWTGAGPTTPLYFHSDHLGTPRIGTTSIGSADWRWDGNAFGSTQPTGAVTVNLRFPGQYFDAETALFQNWHRVFDSVSGRYLQSDPIGLAGGLNTYSYVGGNPVGQIDPTGQVVLADDIVIGGTVLIVGCAITPGCRQAVSDAIEGVGSLIFAKPPRVTDPEAAREWQDYKDRYSEPPPPNLDQCEMLKWQLRREKALLAARQAWDAKWGPHHVDAIAQSQRAVKNFEEKLKKAGCSCP